MKLFKLVCIIFIFVGCASSQKTTDIKTPKLNLPSYSIKELSNGLEVLLIKDTKLPLIQEKWEPKNEALTKFLKALSKKAVHLE